MCCKREKLGLLYSSAFARLLLANVLPGRQHEAASL
jgi:hypothetical protein